MKLSLTLTLRLERTRKPDQEPEPDYINNQGYSHLENAHQPVLGFTPNPTETYNRTETK